MSDFNRAKYFEKLDAYIKETFKRPVKNVPTYDILDTEKSKSTKREALKLKQYQMKIGEIWQETIGSYAGCINLKVGHETGLDILSHTRKFAVELKNRTNTDNASSRKTNNDKLAKFKTEHPEYTCIYAMINCDTEEETIQTKNKKFYHGGVELEQYVGLEFLTFIFASDTNIIIEFLKNTIAKYSTL